MTQDSREEKGKPAKVLFLPTEGTESLSPKDRQQKIRAEIRKGRQMLVAMINKKRISERTASY